MVAYRDMYGLDSARAALQRRQAHVLHQHTGLPRRDCALASGLTNFACIPIGIVAVMSSPEGSSLIALSTLALGCVRLRLWIRICSSRASGSIARTIFRSNESKSLKQVASNTMVILQ